MKKGRNLIIALAVLVVLGVVYILAKQGLFEKTEETGETVYVADLNADDIQEISLQLGEKTVKFVKTDDTWKLESDENFPVDEDKLGTLLDAVADLEAVRELTDAEDVSEYRLDSPSNTITVKNGDGEEIVLSIGDSASTGDIYVNNSAKEGTVYTVSSSFESEFDKDVYDFAQSTDFPEILTDNIQKITVENAGDTYVFYQEEREAEDTDETEDSTDTADESTDEETSEESATEMVWVLQKNEETPVDADSTKVGTLTSQIAGLTYTDYVNYNCTDMSQYGLAEPAAKITVDYTDSDGEEQTTILYVGSTDADGNYYTHVDDNTEIHVVSSSALSEFLGINVDDYKAAEETEETTEDTASEETTE